MVRRGSIIKSVYVIMVVAVSLHQQQSDNFCKIPKEDARWTWAIMYRWSTLSFFLLGPRLYMCELHYSEGKRCMSIAALLAVESDHLAHSHQHPFVRGTGHNWTAGLLTAGCLVVQLRWHPWHTPPPMELTLSLHHYQCQQSAQIFGWASATLASCLVHSLHHHSHWLWNAYWEE